jgi:hypothetical protein
MQDLFNVPYEELPTELVDVLKRHIKGEFTYEECERLQNDLEEIGYTCDYGLDACPINLKKIRL